jgi:integrase/recombinase XerD
MRREPSFSSSLAPLFRRYLELKRALGHDFSVGTQVLHFLDRFLSDSNNDSPDLTSNAFHHWCCDLERLTAGVRRIWMRTIYNFCLYRRRSEAQCFVPDPLLFPKPHQTIRPHIFSESDTARLLAASSRLPRVTISPLRPEVIHLAIALLYSTGMRRSELLSLAMSDYDPTEDTLLISDSNFHKSRVLPLHRDLAEEINCYFQLRRKGHLPMSPDTPFIWNRIGGGRAYTGAALGKTALRALCKQCNIRTAQETFPRVHDFRFSFVANVLLRWYRTGVDVNARLPLLATYLGHVSILSTYYYLQFVEPIRTAASKRFADHYEKLVTPPSSKGDLR